MKNPAYILWFLLSLALFVPVLGKPVGIFTYQHSPEDFTSRFNDTLIAILRNDETPQLLLDTLSTRIPYAIFPFARIVTAATKDFNGNGYIDAINLTFDSDTSVTGINPEDAFTVRYGTNILIVDTVVRTITGNQRQWQLLIKEPEVKDSIPLQTSWTPLVTVDGMLQLRIGSQTIIADDSCAPVILQIKDYVWWSNDRKYDSVSVTFSEMIKNTRLLQFSIANAPAQTFRVWWGNTDESADSLLTGIPAFSQMRGDSCLIFAMSETKRITPDNCININAATCLICDQFGNLPASNNRKVQVWAWVVDDRTEKKPGCGCGTGTILAFLPPLYFKARNRWGRRRKNRKRQWHVQVMRSRVP